MNQSFQELTMDANYGEYAEGETGMTKQEQQNLYRRAVRTLRRIPVDIRLDLATREFNMGLATSCLVGTAIKAALAKATHKELETVDLPWDVTGEAAKRFGGHNASWEEIFYGVDTVDQLPIIERAFVNVLLETV